MERLNAAIATATTGDLQRAAMFLEGAHEVWAGCTNQRALKLVALKQLRGRKRSIPQLRGRVLVAHKRGMAIRHGNKTYFQILLDPHKAGAGQILGEGQRCEGYKLDQDYGLRAFGRRLRTTVYRCSGKGCPGQGNR